MNDYLEIMVDVDKAKIIVKSLNKTELEEIKIFFMKCIEANQLKIRNQSSRIYNFSNKEKEKKINEINLEERYDLDGNVYSIKFRDDVTDKFYIDDYFDSDQIFWTLSRKLINSDWQLTHVIPHPWNTSSDRVYYFSRP